MQKLKEAKVRVENLRTSIREVQTIADDLDNALKSATRVFTPAEIRESASRITESVRKSANHPRSRG